MRDAPEPSATAPAPDPTAAPNPDQGSTAGPDGDDKDGAASVGTGEPGDAVEAAEPETSVALADPLGPLDAALDALEMRGVTVVGRARTQTKLQGRVLTAEIRGDQPDLVQYVLQQTAEDASYVILLAPVARNVLSMFARSAVSGQPPGVLFVKVDDVQFTGTFLRGEEAQTLKTVLGVTQGALDPIVVAAQLQEIGYRAVFVPTDAGRLVVEINPGRSLRRVRIRGHVPLSPREVRRVLGQDARPGALARGQCASPALLKEAPRPAICEPRDLACKLWEEAQIERLERFLFDHGFLAGKASLGLACGRAEDEADLYVFLDKGKPYRIRRKDVVVTGNAPTNEHGWVKRVFRPKVSPFLPIGTRVSRDFMQNARSRVERHFAEPTRGSTASSRRSLSLPYPAVRVETSIDDLDPKDPPKSNRLPLEIRIQLGEGVQTAFLGNDQVSEGRLRKQLRLFERREPANATAARREAENLREYYQARGFPLARVDGRFEDFGALERLTFVINEGPRAKIESLDLVMPETLPPTVRAELVRTLRTEGRLRKRKAFTDPGAVHDMGLVLKELNDRGYLCARAQLRVAFFDGGFEQAGANAVLTPDWSSGDGAVWMEEQLRAEGLGALRRQGRAEILVRLELDPGPRVLSSSEETVRHLEIPIPGNRAIDDLPVTSDGNWSAPRILRDGALRRKGDDRAGGIPVRRGLDRDVRRQIVERYRSSGFPVADAEIRWVYTDGDGIEHRVARTEQLTDSRVGMCSEHAADPMVTVGTELTVYEGKRGEFGSTLLRGNFKTANWVIRRELEWEEQEPYDARRGNSTSRQLDGTGLFDGTTLTPHPVGCDLNDEGKCVVHQVVTVREAKDRAMDLGWGFGGATLDSPYVFVRPTFPNIFGTGWDVQLDGHWGFGWGWPFACEGTCYERSARASVVRRRFLASPLTLDMRAQIQRRVTPARGQIDSVLGQPRFIWPINRRWQVHWGYLIQGANLSKDLFKPNLGSTDVTQPNRGEAIVPDVTGALESGFQFTKTDNPGNPEKGILASVDTMIASPWLGGEDWWIRFDALWQQFVPLPRTQNRLSFRYSLQYGHAIPIRRFPGASTTSIPEVWRYFGGGTVDLGLRGLEPQTMLTDIEEIPGPYGTSTLRARAQGGHIRFLGTLALQVVSVRDFLGGALAHSLFVDFGVLTQKWSHVRFNRDFRRSVGVNFFLWNIQIVTVSLGYAVLVPNAIWPGNVRPTDDQNGRFVFDVGVTF